jgi:hypothetical protein
VKLSHPTTPSHGDLDSARRPAVGFVYGRGSVVPAVRFLRRWTPSRRAQLSPLPAKMLAIAVGSEIPIDAGELVAYPGLIPFEG